MRAAEFDEARREWRVQARVRETENIEARARFLLVCIGFAAKPYFPPIEGIDSFGGACHHTALWPQEGLDFHGKRVGIMARALVGFRWPREAARQAAHLTVFQRTPNLCLPMQQKRLDASANQPLRESYQEFFRKRAESFAGFEYDVNPKSTSRFRRKSGAQAMRNYGRWADSSSGSGTIRTCCWTTPRTGPRTSFGATKSEPVSRIRQLRKSLRQRTHRIPSGSSARRWNSGTSTSSTRTTSS